MPELDGLDPDLAEIIMAQIDLIDEDYPLTMATRFTADIWAGHFDRLEICIAAEIHYGITLSDDVPKTMERISDLQRAIVAASKTKPTI